MARDETIETLVSVCLVTYNQEKLIEKALEGAISQECRFEYEVVIGEDLSTDGTYAICQRYAERYPKRVRLLPTEKGNLGLKENYLRTLRQCRGRYIAYLEGDDYWTDRHKLQKEADILNGDGGVVLVHTNCRQYDMQTGEEKASLIQHGGQCVRERGWGRRSVECEYRGEFRHVKTSTCMFRKEVMMEILREDEWAYRNSEFPTFDFQLFQDMAYRGRYAFIDEETTTIVLHDSISVPTDRGKRVAYRIGFHKIGEYYIKKYNIGEEIANEWRRRETHWFLDWGMRYREARESVNQWIEEQEREGVPFTKRQKIMAILLRHRWLCELVAPVYRGYRRKRG